MSVAVPRLTPWVARLIAANAVIQLLLMTVLTADSIQSALAFSAATALHQPWSFVTYMFVHAGILHLAFNMLALYVFGTAVENRMGSRAFLVYYLYCGIGAAVFSLALSRLGLGGPMVGASGAVFGLALAFAMFWPDAELLVFPWPVPIRARTLVTLLVGFSIFFGLVWRNSPMSGVAHMAHLGGVLAGYLFFRVQAISQRAPQTVPRPVERVVTVTSSARESERPATTVHPIGRSGNDPLSAELDRVLDKISAKGMSSLTPEERRFLDEVSRRKQQDH